MDLPLDNIVSLTAWLDISVRLLFPAKAALEIVDGVLFQAFQAIEVAAL